MKERVAASHTARIGDRKRAATLWKKEGQFELESEARLLLGYSTYNTAVTRKREHHTAVAGHAEKTAVPDTDCWKS